jgi:hypothetical protein
MSHHNNTDYLERKEQEFREAKDRKDARRAVGILRGLQLKGYNTDALYKELNEALAS